MGPHRCCLVLGWSPLAGNFLLIIFVRFVGSKSQGLAHASSSPEAQPGGIASGAAGGALLLTAGRAAGSC